MAEQPRRVVTDSMIGMNLPDQACWSPLVTVVLGQNPGPFTGPGTNTYVVGNGRQRLLLDTGQGASGYLPLLSSALADSCGGAVLDRIVVTHAHPDHIGGVASLRAEFGALPLVKMPWPGHDMGFELEPLADGDVVRVEGATLRAVHTPGHAADHLCFLLEEENALFTGDVVLGAGTTVIPPDGDLGLYLASLERILELEVERLYPAHGPAIDEPERKVREILAHRRLRDAQILDGLDAGVDTIEALVARIYTDVPEFLHRAAGVSVHAHLRRFVSEGVVVEAEGRWARAS